jgi:hypothetical protein
MPSQIAQEMEAAMSEQTFSGLTLEDLIRFAHDKCPYLSGPEHGPTTTMIRLMKCDVWPGHAAIDALAAATEEMRRERDVLEAKVRVAVMLEAAQRADIELRKEAQRRAEKAEAECARLRELVAKQTARLAGAVTEGWDAATKSVERFRDSLRWSPEASEHEKALVIGNLNGAIAALQEPSRD